jgi:hypothetical protein
MANLGWSAERALTTPNIRLDKGASFICRITYEPNTGCWLWTGQCNNNGYGQIGSQLVHRYSYERFKGAVPHGMHVLHACDQPSCCNPDHLSVGNHADNMADMVAKGRNAKEKPSLQGEGHFMAELDADAVRDIMTKQLSGAEYARRYGVSDTAIFSIWRGKSWRSVTGYKAPGPAGRRIKLNEDAVRHIRRQEMRGADYARMYGVTPQLICLVQKRQKWAHVQ